MPRDEYGEFIYIKPEDREKYERMGYTIKEGPRRGIRAYLPNRTGDGEIVDYNSGVSIDQIVEKLDPAKIKEEYGVDMAIAAEVLQTGIRSRNKNMVFSGLIVLFRSGVISREMVDKITDMFGGKKEMAKWIKGDNVVRVKEAVFSYPAFRNFAVQYGEGYIMPKIFITKEVGYIISRRLHVYSKITFFRNLLNIKSEEELLKYVDTYFGKLRDILYDDDYERIVAGDFKKLWSFIRMIFDNKNIEVKPKNIDKLREFSNKENFWSLERYFDRQRIGLEILDEDKLYGFNKLTTVYKVFKDLGYNDDEAASLTKSWYLMRAWTSTNYDKIVRYIEDIFEHCFGNGRMKRAKGLDESNLDSDVFGSVILNFNNDCKALKSYIRFVQEYMRQEFGDRVVLYRGMGNLDGSLALLSYLAGEGIVLKGRLYSTTVDKYFALELSDSNDTPSVKIDVPIEYVVGNWLNSSMEYDNGEQEVIIEAPRGGLRVEFLEDAARFMDEDYVNLVMEQGIESIIEFYGESNIEEMKKILQEMLRLALKAQERNGYDLSKNINRIVRILTVIGD